MYIYIYIYIYIGLTEALEREEIRILYENIQRRLAEDIENNEEYIRISSYPG